jgi:hypothetical protein
MSWLEGERRDDGRVRGPGLEAVRVTLTPNDALVPIEARLLDFSRTGARFRGPVGLEVGSRVLCRLVLESAGSQSVEFQAEVRWCLRTAEGHHDLGVRIVGGATEDRLVVFERFLRYQKDSARR